MTVPDKQADLVNVNKWHNTINTADEQAAFWKNLTDTVGLNYDDIQLLGTSFQAYRTEINRVVAEAPNLETDLQRYYADPAFNLAAEQAFVVGEISGVLNWLIDNLPKDSESGRWILGEEFVDGAVASREFTPQQLAGLSAELDFKLIA